MNARFREVGISRWTLIWLSAFTPIIRILAGGISSGLSELTDRVSVSGSLSVTVKEMS